MAGADDKGRRDLARERALLRAPSGRERARLLKEPPALPTRTQRDVLRRVAAAGGVLAAEFVHYRTGLVLTARRWLRLAHRGEALVFELTEAGRDVLERSGR